MVKPQARRDLVSTGSVTAGALGDEHRADTRLEEVQVGLSDLHRMSGATATTRPTYGQATGQQQDTHQPDLLQPRWQLPPAGQCGVGDSVLAHDKNPSRHYVTGFFGNPPKRRRWCSCWEVASRSRSVADSGPLPHGVAVAEANQLQIDR
jgi:hypothetical protein